MPSSGQSARVAGCLWRPPSRWRLPLLPSHRMGLALAILTTSDLPRTIRGRPTSAGCLRRLLLILSRQGASLAKKTRFSWRCILAAEEWACSRSLVSIAGQITVPQPPEPRCRGRRPTAMMDIPSAAGPDRRRIVYLLAALVGVAAGLAVGLAARPTARWIPADARVVTVTPVFGMSPASTLPHPASWEKPDSPRGVLFQPRGEVRPRVHDHRSGHGGQDRRGHQRLRPGRARHLQLPGEHVGPHDAARLPDRLGDPVIASVTAEDQGCQWVWVTIGAHTLPALFQYTISEQPMQQRILTIARVSWPYPLK